MALESFYGGKQGLSSVIRKAFKYISTEDPDYVRLPSGSSSEKGTREYAIANNQVMEYCFRDNNYQEVWYGELCLIDTINKNNPANGCLFRRTLARQGSDYPVELYSQDEFNQYWSETPPSKLSAEYIGKITGPKGGAPFLFLESMSDIDNRAKGETEPIDYYYDKTIWSKTATQNVYNELLPQDQVVYRRSALGNNVFISGKNYTQNNDIDDIVYNWFNLNKSGEESLIYLGLQIPYPEFDFEFIHENYYSHGVSKNDYPGRLFYQDWHIYIPRGVKGNGTTEIGIITLREAAQKQISIFQSFDALSSNTTTGNYNFNTNAARVNDTFLTSKVQGIDSSITDMQDVPFYYCKYTIYNSDDTDEKGHSEYFYLGIPKDVDYFTLSNDGYITVHYKDNSNQQLENRINWVTSITMNPTGLDSDAGEVTIVYNDNHEDVYQLKLINNITYDDTTGKFSYTNTGENASHLMDGEVIHPKTIEYDNLTGTFLITNNAGSPISYRTNTDSPIKYVDSIEYSDHDGQFTITYNSGTDREVINTNEDLIRYYKSIIFDKASGLFTGISNLGEENVLNPDGAISYPTRLTYDDSTGIISVYTNIETDIPNRINADTPITYLKSISLKGDAAADGSDYRASRRIKYTTNTNSDIVSLGDEINYIQDFIRNPRDCHLYVLFNSPSHRYDGAAEGYPTQAIDEDGHIWRNDVAEGYSPKLYWRDYGLAIGYREGLYVGKVIPLEYDDNQNNYIYENNPDIRINNYQDIIDLILDVEYPEGFTKLEGETETVNRAGMLAVARLKSESDPNFYDTYYFAYNYDKVEDANKKWFLIQKTERASLTIGMKIDDTSSIDVDNMYLNITEYPRTVNTLDAPWLQGGVYALSSI